MMPGTAHMIGGVLIRDGKLLLGLRSPAKTLFPACWDVIGGHAMPNESDEDALIRELDEEIGVRPLVFARCARAAVPGLGQLVVFGVTEWRGEPAIRDDEHSRLEWFSVAQACALRPLAAPEYATIFRRLEASSIGPD